MTRAYNVIDADGHILEPLDLWAKYMDPKFRDRAPRLVKDNETGKEKLLIEAQMLGSEHRLAYPSVTIAEGGRALGDLRQVATKHAGDEFKLRDGA